MPKRRKTLEELERTGTLGRNIGKYQRRIDARQVIYRPIGHAPTGLSSIERAIWSETVRNAPEKLLTRSDRLALEVLVRMVARMRSKDSVSKSSELNAIVGILSKLGMTALDRAKFDLKPSVDPAEQAVLDALSELD